MGSRYDYGRCLETYRLHDLDVGGHPIFIVPPLTIQTLYEYNWYPSELLLHLPKLIGEHIDMLRDCRSRTTCDAPTAANGLYKLRIYSRLYMGRINVEKELEKVEERRAQGLIKVENIVKHCLLMERRTGRPIDSVALVLYSVNAT